MRFRPVDPNKLHDQEQIPQTGLSPGCTDPAAQAGDSAAAVAAVLSVPKTLGGFDLKKSILAIALALFVSGLAGAASLGEFRIKAPEPFTVGGTAMPAGVYNIEQVSPAGVLQITNTATSASVLVIGSPISAPESGPGKVTFTAVAGKYALAQVYLPSGAGFALSAHAAR